MNHAGRTSLGLRLRHAREELRKLTQQQLARAAGIKQPSISEIETGETREVSGPTLIALSDALKVRPEWLLTGKLPMEYGEGEKLSQDERELLERYRAATPRWRSSILYMAALKGDVDQDEVAETVLERIAAQPASEYRVRRTRQPKKE